MDVATRARDVFGARASDECVCVVKMNLKLVYEIEGDGVRDGVVRVVLGKKSYVVEELVGMTLEYAMVIGEAAGRGKICDVVIVVLLFVL